MKNNNILDNPFIILVERWIVIPLLGFLIAHGFFMEHDAAWFVPVMDNVFSIIFMMGAYGLSNKFKPLLHLPHRPTADTLVHSRNQAWEAIKSIVYEVDNEQTSPKNDTTQSSEIPAVNNVPVSAEHPATTQ